MHRCGRTEGRASAGGVACRPWAAHGGPGAVCQSEAHGGAGVARQANGGDGGGRGQAVLGFGGDDLMDVDACTNLIFLKVYRIPKSTAASADWARLGPAHQLR